MATFSQFDLYSMHAGMKNEEAKEKDKCDLFIDKIKKGGTYCTVCHEIIAMFGEKEIVDGDEIISSDTHYEFEDGAKTLDFEYKDKSLRVVAKKNDQEFYSNEYIYNEEEILFMYIDKNGNEVVINEKGVN